MKTQLIDGALASSYYNFVIEKGDESLDTVRKCSNTHPIPVFFNFNSNNKERKNMLVLLE